MMTFLTNMIDTFTEYLFSEHGLMGILVIMAVMVIVFLYRHGEEQRKENMSDMKRRMDFQEENFSKAVNSFTTTTQQFVKQGEVLEDIKDQMVQVSHAMEKVTWELDKVSEKVDRLEDNIDDIKKQ